MDEASLHNLLSGRRRDVGARLLRGALGLASYGYGAAVTVRNMAYDCGWLAVHRAAVPVVSLGNITTGGTGKTPLAAWLANWLVAHGLRPGLLSRGYRALDTGPGEPGAAGNDEKRVLDRLCPGVPHLQQRDRVQSSQRLVDELSCDVLILDDGFQHRRLARDLDLLLVDALQPWGFGHVLPRGLLRESRSSLRRADLVIVTRADQASPGDGQRLRADLEFFRGHSECVEVAFRPQRLLGLDGSLRDPGSIAGLKGLAFCGIGNPDGFRRTLGTMRFDCELQVFPDHHHYDASDLAALSAKAEHSRAGMVLTTLKDLVKIPPTAWTGPPLYAVDIGVEFLSGEELLTDRLQKLLLSKLSVS